MTSVAPRPSVTPMPSAPVERAVSQLEQQATDATMRMVWPSLRFGLIFMAPAFAADLAVRAMAHMDAPGPMLAFAGGVAAVGLIAAVPQARAAVRAAKALVSDIHSQLLRRMLSTEAAATQAVALLLGGLVGWEAAAAAAGVGGLFAGYFARQTKETKHAQLSLEKGSAVMAAAAETS